MRFLDIITHYAPRCRYEGYGPVENKDLEYLLKTGIYYRLTTFVFFISLVVLSVILYYKW